MKLAVRDLFQKPYRSVWEYQHHLHQKRLEGRIPDTLLLVEHFPVYTIGTQGKVEHITANAEFLETYQLEVISVDRGGDVTCHLPGQLVGYLIFDLHAHQPDLSWYLDALERAGITLLSQFGIPSTTHPSARGVWVGDQKIMAIGIKLIQWVSLHGFALNVDPDLTLYHGIIPCGLHGTGVTSMAQCLKQSIAMETIKTKIIPIIKQVFHFEEVTIIQENE